METKQIDKYLDSLTYELKKIADENHIINDLQKAIRLKNLGFENSNETKVLTPDVDEDKLLLPYTINHYIKTYPFLRFLTLEKLKDVCRKYNLVFAPSRNYIGTIPDKNLIEIENAQLLLEADKPEENYFLKVFHFYGEKRPGMESFILPQIKEYLKNWVIYKGNIMDWNQNKKFGYSEVRSLSYMLQNALHLTHNETWFVSADDMVVKGVLDGLYICAPESNFIQLNDLIKEDDNSFYNREGFEKERHNKIFINEDPIVFRFCRGGVQILSRWGKEGNIEEINNSNNN